MCSQVTSGADIDHRDQPAEQFGIVAIAASAGGLRALSAVIGPLPADLPVPVLVVQHLDPRHETVIADILARRSKLKVKLAEHGETALPGVVYFAPPDRHLLIEEDGRPGAHPQ